MLAWHLVNHIDITLGKPFLGGSSGFSILLLTPASGFCNGVSFVRSPGADPSNADSSYFSNSGRS